MKLFYSIFMLSLVSLFGSLLKASTDSALIVFTHTEFDFGQIYEADGNVVISYQFENQGKNPLIINKIFSPGLSVEKYPKDPINSGEKAEIILLLNPFYYSGYYFKKISVFTNAVNSPSELILKGKILHGSFSENYKFSVGSMAFRQAQLNFGYLYNEKPAVRFIPVMNKSDKPISVFFDSIPEHITVKPLFEKLDSHQQGMIEVKYFVDKLDDWDFVIDRIRVTVIGDKVSRGVLTVSANIREDFTQLTEEQRLNTPIAVLPVKIYNFDTIKQGKKVFYDFLIKNDGTRDLIIHSVKPTCGCTAAMPEKDLIHPGDSAHIRVNFNSEGFVGLNKKGVTVITNDPVNYKQFLWITGYVKQ